LLGTEVNLGIPQVAIVIESDPLERHSLIKLHWRNNVNVLLLLVRQH